jgi:hypothetical protein
VGVQDALSEVPVDGGFSSRAVASESLNENLPEGKNHHEQRSLFIW